MTIVARVMEDFVAPFSEVAGADGMAGAAEKIAAALQRRIGGARFDLWFDRKTRFSLEGNALIVEAANTFSANWIRGKFGEDLRAAVQECVERTIEICVRVSDAVAAAPVGNAPVEQAAPRPTNYAMASAASNAPVINSKYTLDEFVVGPSNQLAFQAAQQVAQQPGQQYNPLFLHGHCGIGKTHLLQGICQKFAKLHPGKKWLYMTGEQFTNEFLEAIKAHKTDAFRKRIRNADLLVIDDVHFLANKKATQEEFLHTFNQVDACGKQVVLASDCAPKQIHALSEQLSSRFVSGMVLRIDSPDLPTRLEILRRRVARNQWNVSDAVLMHIAQSATSSVRELEGMLLQVIAGIRLINSGSPDASTVLTSIKERTAMRGPVPIERIVAAAAEHFSLEAALLMGSGREKTVSMARAVAMHLARQHTGMSYPELGRAMGNKNHSTVIAACQRIGALISSGEIVCWNTGEGVRHQAVSDILHDLEAVIRRVK
jgi:chromosomal replication initiator protein